MGYTTHAECDLVGLGVSAISHIGDSYAQNHSDLTAWEVAVEGGRLPVWRGLEMDEGDALRADVIRRLMCSGEIDIVVVEQRFGIGFRDYFSDTWRELERLAGGGLVVIDERRIAATSQGRYLLRIIAMCFDQYLKADSAARFSKAI